MMNFLTATIATSWFIARRMSWEGLALNFIGLLVIYSLRFLFFGRG